MNKHQASLDTKANDTKHETTKAANQQGVIGTGGSINDPPDMSCRTRAIEFAIDMHRGKDKPAADIVKEALVLETYLRTGKVMLVPDAAPVAPAGVMTPPG